MKLPANERNGEIHDYLVSKVSFHLMFVKAVLNEHKCPNVDRLIGEALRNVVPIRPYRPEKRWIEQEEQSNENKNNEKAYRPWRAESTEGGYLGSCTDDSSCSN
jgi:hypothetical protein